MQTHSTYHSDQITRYLCGEATPDEIRELEQWVKADPANREEFAAFAATWKAVEDTLAADPAETENAWETLRSRISPEESQTPIDPVRRKTFKIQHSLFNIRYSNSVSWSLRIAAMLLLILVPAFFLYRYLAAPADMILSGLDEPAEHVLPDGSVVTLNTGATLVCPEKFTGAERRVTLQGEAWFDVAHDRSKPFVIAMENARIQVLGTTFFVNTRTPAGTREVILSTGSVKVYYEDNPGEMAILAPGDRAGMTSAGHRITTTRNGDPNFLAWKTRRLEFSNTPLNEVAALLTKVYRTPVRISGGGLNNCRITTTFDKQSLESVLNVLKATLDLQVRHTGAGIELSGRDCN